MGRLNALERIVSVITLLAAIVIPTSAWAQAGPAKWTEAPDLTFQREGDPDTFLRPTIKMATAWFFQDNAWAGEDDFFLGGDSEGWAEYAVQPGLEGQVDLDSAGRLRARASLNYTGSALGLDAGGSNFNPRYPDKLTLEEAFVGWSSGSLFPSLGEDAIDLSVGSQQYHLSDGFLFYDGGNDGGERGGFWLGFHNAFEMTAFARLNTGPFFFETMYLRPNDDNPNTSTDLVGVNTDYSFDDDRGKIGAGYWNIVDSQDRRRDGLNVLYLRAEGQPLADLDGLRLQGEIVFEKNGTKNESMGGWIQSSFQFDDDVPGSPKVSYRYSGFSGDDGKGSNNTAFDPLFYGFGDWGTWYLGEVAGEYVIGNQNLDVHTFRLQFEPIRNVSANIFYYYFRLREKTQSIISRPPTSTRNGLITDRDLAHEIDFIADWSATEWLDFSFVLATLFPVAGGDDFFGNNEPWTSGMIWAQIKL